MGHYVNQMFLYSKLSKLSKLSTLLRPVKSVSIWLFLSHFQCSVLPVTNNPCGAPQTSTAKVPFLSSRNGRQSRPDGRRRPMQLKRCRHISLLISDEKLHSRTTKYIR